MTNLFFISYSRIKEVLEFKFPQTESELDALVEERGFCLQTVFSNFWQALELVEEIERNTNALDSNQYQQCVKLTEDIKANFSFFNQSYGLLKDETPNFGSELPIEDVNTVAKNYAASYRREKNRDRLLAIMTVLACVAIDGYGKKNGRNDGNNVKPLLKMDGNVVKINKTNIKDRILELVAVAIDFRSKEGDKKLSDKARIELGKTLKKKLGDGLERTTISEELKRVMDECPEIFESALRELKKMFLKTDS